MTSEQITSSGTSNVVNGLRDQDGVNGRTGLKILIVGAGIGVSLPVEFSCSLGIKILLGFDSGNSSQTARP